MKSFYGFALLLACLFPGGCLQPDLTPEYEEEGMEEEGRKEDGIRDAFEEDFRRTYDPALGYPPKERLIAAYAQIRKMNREMGDRRSLTVENPRFVERGPNNIGGRTRSIMIDVRDPSRNTVWVGSVAGGLWKTTDITSDNPVWVAVDDYLANLAIGCIAQDQQNPQNIYVGTGEGFPNFEAVQGLGIFKSSDGGNTFALLPSTNSSIFWFTRSIIVHPQTGDIYAATRDGGMRRSQDGGQTWIKVLGVALNASDDAMYDVQYSNGKLYASNSTNIYSSTTGNRGEWTDITLNASGFPESWSRCEMHVCDENPNVIYAVGSQNGGATDVWRTTTGGQNWTPVQPPTEGDFTNGQAWYDLEIAVDPFNCDHVIVGGVGIYRTLNGGFGWQRFDQQMHVDQHKTVFDPMKEGVVMFGNDGGVWYSDDGSNIDPLDKNPGYITTQYYGCAMHPDSFSNYFLGGTQDNGSHRLNGSGATFGANVRGGDGFYCHIDEDDPNIQMVSSQFGSWGLSTNGGVNFSGGQELNGGFINPSDYDSRSNILYAQTGDGDYYRWNVVSNLLEVVDISSAGGGQSFIYVDPNIENRVYFGYGNGRVIRVDNAHLNPSVTGTVILNAGGGSISGIDVLKGNSDRIIVTLSNYGVNNVYVTSDGGARWVMSDGNLPDMPVRACLFNPRNGDEAMIATEAGVWTTALLDSANTVWIPPMEGRGIPITRTDDLEIRYSDYVVLAGTHGRGLWTSSVFSDTRARFFAPLIHYVNSPLQFIGDVSLNADSYSWLFGDGGSSAEVNPLHTYTEIGQYNVQLTINSSLSTDAQLKILPDAMLPYVKGRVWFGGSFENHEEQYGVHTVSGSGFERGKSGITGKHGTKTGDFAYVIGLNEPAYQANSESYLYLPVFDFSDENIYTLSFWANYRLHPGPDGFLLEYSTDRGQSWQVLGTNADKKWYNFNNTEVATTAFPNGTSYFTGDVGGYTNFTHDLTFLAGQSDVAFRFVFRSESTGNHVGVAIDDFEIFAFEGELKTTVESISGRFSGDKDIELEWATRPEYYARRFEVERSANGIDFEKIDDVQAKGILSANLTEYDHLSNGGRDLYFYRLKVISDNPATGYHYEFYSDTITLRRDQNAPVGVYLYYPNPFSNEVNITFNDLVEQHVTFEVFDASGKQIWKEASFVNTPFYKLELGRWPQGVYFLSVQIGEEEEKVFKLVSQGY